MAADTVISGVIRGILPYAVIGGAGFLGYMWLNKNGYLDGIKKTVDAVAEVPSRFVDEVKNRTGITDAQNGDFIGAAQKIVRTTVPIVNVWEAEYNFVKDNLPEVKIDPPQLPDPPQVTQENTGISESVWTDTPLKYVPAVAIRNGITKLFGR